MPDVDREPGVGEHAGGPRARPLLLELQLGMRVDAMTERRRASASFAATVSRAARSWRPYAVASHRARRRRNGRRCSASDPARPRSSSTSTARSRRSSNDPRTPCRCPRRSTCCAASSACIGRVGDRERPAGRVPRRRSCRCPGSRSRVCTAWSRCVDGERARRSAGRCRTSTAVAAAADEADARLPGVLVERKAGVSVTLHWRTAPERADEVHAVAADARARLRARRAARRAQGGRAAAAGRGRQGHRGRRA